MKNALVSVCISLAVLITPTEGASFRQGQHVELIKDEDLYFNTTVFRRGNKGEQFVVGEHRPAQHRLFVLSRDDNKQVIALNLPDSSASPLITEWVSDAEKAYQALEQGRIRESRAFLSGFLSDPKMPPVSKQILESITAAETKFAEFQLFHKNKTKIEEEISQQKKGAEKLRNTPNTLISGSNRNDNQASRLEDQANKMRQQLNSSDNQIHEFLEKSIAEMVNTAEQLEENKAHTEAYVLLSAAQNLKKQASSLCRENNFRESFSGRLSSNKRIAENSLRTIGSVRSAISAKQFSEAGKSIGEALSKDPGSFLLNRLYEDIKLRTPHTPGATVEAPLSSGAPAPAVSPVENKNQASPGIASAQKPVPAKAAVKPENVDFTEEDVFPGLKSPKWKIARRGPVINGIHLGMSYADFRNRIMTLYPSDMQLGTLDMLNTEIAIGDVIDDPKLKATPMGFLALEKDVEQDFSYPYLFNKNLNLIGTPAVSFIAAGPEKTIVYFGLNRVILNKLFKASSLSYDEFCQKFINGYNIPELKGKSGNGRSFMRYTSPEGWAVVFNGTEREIIQVQFFACPSEKEQGFGK